MIQRTELEWIRRRWRDHLRSLGFPDPSRADERSPAGLARRVPDLSTRIVIVPVDPLATRLEFDEEMWEWWSQVQSTPFGDRSLTWNESVPTADAAVHARTGMEGWATYLAVHRHGGVELGTSDTYETYDRKCFRLIRTVGLLWLAVATEAEVIRHVELDGPWIVLLAIYDTEGAVLGNVAEGWAEPGQLGTRTPECRESNVVVREELESWPEDPDERRELALRLGGRIEDAWGTRQRRFIASGGDLEGEFDRREWRL